jgi:hypothetical protein
MSLISKVARFARSPQGRRMANEAVRLARDPKTKRQIMSARQKLVARNSGRRA